MAGPGAILAGLLLGYAFGSVPFGLLLTRLAGLGDVRAIGSGNIGATNVLRTGRKGLAAATLLLDALKGTVPVLLAARFVGTEASLAAAIGAVLGHCFPVWLGFRGGKAVATYMGCLLAVDWRAFLAFAAAWLAVAAISRYSSLASLVGSVAAAGLAWWLDSPPLAATLSVLVVIVFLRHHANIGRLLSGQEGRIGGRP